MFHICLTENTIGIERELLKLHNPENWIWKTSRPGYSWTIYQVNPDHINLCNIDVRVFKAPNVKQYPTLLVFPCVVDRLRFQFRLPGIALPRRTSLDDLHQEIPGRCKTSMESMLISCNFSVIHVVCHLNLFLYFHVFSVL